MNTTGNPVADSMVKIDEGKPGKQKEPVPELDFSTLLSPEFSPTERLELSQNLRKMLINKGMQNLDMSRAMSYQSLAGLINDFSKQELDLMKMEKEGENSAAFKGFAEQIGNMLMGLPSNDKLPGFNPSGAEENKGNAKELGDDIPKVETVPGNTHIGVEKLSADDFIA
ncbi:MAG: hypothetical protein M0R77_00545 [Gammaproteobacteria bacterium]|nr:hypothetical protein [Acholeplasmataceae bacterium]MCK9529042.1 hypothetical protein [Gammaproteobacteria bacterium]